MSQYEIFFFSTSFCTSAQYGLPKVAPLCFLTVRSLLNISPRRLCVMNETRWSLCFGQPPPPPLHLSDLFIHICLCVCVYPPIRQGYSHWRLFFISAFSVWHMAKYSGASLHFSSSAFSVRSLLCPSLVFRLPLIVYMKRWFWSAAFFSFLNVNVSCSLKCDTCQYSYGDTLFTLSHTHTFTYCTSAGTTRAQNVCASAAWYIVRFCGDIRTFPAI